MKSINDSIRGSRAVRLLPVLLLGGLLLAGCESDSVAPQDEAPALAPADVAQQAGSVAMAAALVAPETVEFAGKGEKDSYDHTFTGDVSGVVHLDFFADGSPSGWQAADHADLYTDDEAPLVISVGMAGYQGTVLLGFDIAAAIDRDADPDEAVVTGGGTFVSGPYTASFSFDSLAVYAGGAYPTSGAMSFVSGGYTASVSFDGTSQALVTVGTDAWIVDLDTGEISPAITIDG